MVEQYSARPINTSLVTAARYVMHMSVRSLDYKPTLSVGTWMLSRQL